MTHYIPVFTQFNGRLQKAACGYWLNPREHSAEPTCPTCLRYVQLEASEAHLTAEDVFGDDAHFAALRKGAIR